MHILKRELRANLKSLLIWSCSIVLLIIAMMTEYSAFHGNSEMSEILNTMPKAMLDAFSMSGANLTTVEGYFSVASIYFYLLPSVFAVLLGSGIISKEERDKTAEFFLTLPVSRKQVLTNKALAAGINCLILNLVMSASILVSVQNYDPSNETYKFLGLMMLAIFITEIIFMSIGMFFAAFIKRYKNSGKLAASTLLVMYMINIATNLSEKIEFLKYLTPFKYFEASHILRENSLEFKYIVISLFIILISLIGTFVIYPKRDLHI